MDMARIGTSSLRLLQPDARTRDPRSVSVPVWSSVVAKSRGEPESAAHSSTVVQGTYSRKQISCAPILVQGPGLSVGVTRCRCLRTSAPWPVRTWCTGSTNRLTCRFERAFWTGVGPGGASLVAVNRDLPVLPARTTGTDSPSATTAGINPLGETSSLSRLKSNRARTATQSEGDAIRES